MSQVVGLGISEPSTVALPFFYFQAALESAPSNFTGAANFTGVGLGGAVLASQECSLQERAWKLSGA